VNRSIVLRVVDAALIAVLAISAQLDVWGGSETADGGHAVHALLAALFTVPLFLRRRYPLAVAAVVSASAWMQFQLGGGLYQSWFAMLLAAYALGAHATLRASAAGLGLIAIVIGSVDIPRLQAGAPLDEVLPAWAVVALVWLAGEFVRGRRRDVEDLKTASARLEAERELQTAEALAAERTRIARELHDLVAHSMSVINVQAQGAQRALESDPDATRAALSAIETASREGLDEMRRLLAVLRETDGPVPLQPMPGLDSLPGLVQRTRAAGLAVKVEVIGEPHEVGHGVELTAYRVIQEALTNALRHGQLGEATVRLTWSPDQLDIDVVNPIGPARGHEARSGEAERVGQGLIGMRERVALYAGTLESRATPDGQFAIRASLPASDGTR
jgi:signal transduction histidine kinase